MYAIRSYYDEEYEDEDVDEEEEDEDSEYDDEDEDEDEEDDDYDDEADMKDRDHVVRTPVDRRGRRRRKADYSPLPNAAGAYEDTADNGRGRLLMMAAFVLVGIFGVVVWNMSYNFV